MSNEKTDYNLNDAEVQKRLAELDSMPDETVNNEVGPLPNFEPTPIGGLQPVKHGFFARIGRILTSWKFWLGFMLLLIIGTAIAWFLQPSRIWILNQLGQQASITVHATQAGSNAKIHNFQVTIDGRQANSANKSSITITGIQYGAKQLVVSKAGHQTNTLEIFVDIDPLFGLLGKKASNLYETALRATGDAVSFEAQDWLSGEPISKATFRFGDVDVTPDSKGIVKLMVPQTNERFVKVQAKFNGAYIDKTIEVDVKSKFIKIQTFDFVPSGKHYFVQKKAGTFNVYKSNIDGSAVEEFIKGTPDETSAPSFVVSPNGKQAVMVSAKDGARDSGGRLLQNLYTVDLQTGKQEAIDEGILFTYFDWSGQSLVYSVSNFEDKTTDPVVSLHSVDITTKKVANLELGKAAIWAVYVAQGQVVYAYQNSFQSTAVPIVATTSVTGANRKDLASNATAPIQIEATKFMYSAGSKWYEYNINTSQTTDAKAPTDANGVHYVNVASPDSQKRLLVNRFDTQETLILKQGETTKQLYGSAGLRGPIRWVSNEVVVFRVAQGANAVDYAISLRGGAPKKIADVVTLPASAVPAPDYFALY